MEYVLKPVRYAKLTEILLRAIDRVDKRRHNEQMKHYATQYIGSLTKEVQGDSANALDTAVSYIDAHLAEELSVRELAGQCYVSADHLTRLFKKKFGMTVSEYIQDKRFRLAGDLLANGNLSVSAVSNTVGFGNYSYFTEQFKKYYGMTPREYQKKKRE
jgi:AraC-like DNA-binding protein